MNVINRIVITICIVVIINVLAFLGSRWSRLQ